MPDHDRGYVFGGLGLKTDFRFDQLNILGERTPRSSLVLDSATVPAPADTIVHRANGRYKVTLGRVADGSGRWVFRSGFPDSFLFDPAERRIACHIASDDARAWQDVLFRRVLPRAATLYGATTIHAATIAIQDRCLLLLGQSGAGKSTLTTFCARAGWHVLSDDTSVLWVGDRIVAEPVQHGTGIWEDARDALALPPADCVVMPGYGARKWCYQPAGAPPAPACEVSGIVVLERSAVAAPVLAPLTREESLRVLTHQQIPFLPNAAPDAAVAASFGRLAALARRVPGLRLTYPDGYASLPAVERLLRDMSLADGAP